MQLTGIHHVSALSAHIGRTHDFYTRVLGLRPLIKTVNQDEPTMYHLFFGDGAGSPGSDITFFDLPHAAPERHGNNSISLTTFRIAGPEAAASGAPKPPEITLLDRYPMVTSDVWAELCRSAHHFTVSQSSVAARRDRPTAASISAGSSITWST